MKTKIPIEIISSTFSILIFLFSFLIISTNISFGQVDTTKLKREQQETIKEMKDAQKKGLEQLKKMGIDIDPNKKMSKEDAKKLKEKLLKSAEKMQEQFQNQKDQFNAQNEKKHTDIVISSSLPTSKEIVQIADRYYKRSYKELNAIEKNAFDLDYKQAEKNNFTLKDVRKLGNKGAELITFGNNHHFACVYITAAVKSNPDDTLSINNFGGYLRIIDSLKTSLPVLLYANKLFSQSPVILTQIGCSLLELGDEIKAEKYLKEALKYNPGFGQAHTALTEVYIRQHRLKDAILELFASVKGMGASYQQASMSNYQIQQQYDASGKGDFKSKQEFWNETRNQLDPSNLSDALAPLVPELTQIKMPRFPNCVKVEDWTLGGGQMGAMEAFQAFHKYDISFTKEFQSVHMQVPELPENATLRDYPNERFALDCITEMFMAFSKEESKKYQKIIDDIVQRMGDAKIDYIKRFNKYREEYLECLKPCAEEYEDCKKQCDRVQDPEARERCSKRCSEIHEVCTKNCSRQYCERQCPNANEYNTKLRVAYGSYKAAFNQMMQEQKKLLDDLYAFSNPWFQKIYSPYWSKIYAYEVRRVALSIIGNTYMYYPQFFDVPVNDECGSDCSVYATPFRVPPEEVDKNNPKGNNCPPNTKFKISLEFCDLGFDCESIEFGCTAILSGSVKRNFKMKNTTVFFGVGVKGELGVVEAEAKAGAEITFNDKGGVDDVGGKMEVSGEIGIGAAKFGGEASGSLTVMKGLGSEVNFTAGVGK